MKFRFCGGLDCPDWILAEIALLSKLTSIKFRVLCQIVCQGIVENSFQHERAEKILTEGGLGTAEVKGCLAAMAFIIKSAAKYECGSSSLLNELQQLGLPAELAQQISKIYDDNQLKIRASSAESSFKLPLMVESSGSIAQTEDGVRFAQLKMTFVPKSNKTLLVSEQKLDLLVKELDAAVNVMERL